MSKRGRKRKFQDGSLVWHDHYGWCVTVDWNKGDGNNYYYRIIRVLHPFNGAPYGEAVWVKSYTIRPPDEGETLVRTRKSVAHIYKANSKLIERGCRCNCCAHEAIPRRQIRPDGSFRWEEEDE